MQTRRPLTVLICLAVTGGGIAMAALAAARSTASSGFAAGVTIAADPVDFGRDVRPLLARSCLACHGFDPSTREMDLRLDTFAGATAARGDRPPAIVPGDPDASILLDRIAAHDPIDRMPPIGDPLTADEVDVIRRWIAEGAEYTVHWSLEPVRAVDPPATADEAWSAPVDAFIHVAIDEAGLEPAPRASRRTLARRLAFDLAGMPMTPEEVDAYVDDPASDEEATAALVDRLLASPHFGERWARHWLDLVRYAETHGHEFDYPIHDAWRYRDYVIRAFADDVPYDTFVTEHVAGDLMDPPRRNPEDGTNESILGTGFWWLGQGTHGPTDVRLDEAERIDNQIDVLTKTFLASTVSCARCHDHKFDPITQAEYYGFSGYLQSSRRQRAYLDPHQRIGAASAELARFDAALRAAADERVRPALDAARRELPAMVDAARDVRFGTPAPGERPPADFDRMLANFDGEDWGDWTVFGEAFGDGPHAAGRGAIAGRGTAVGRGFANSHVREDGGDSVAADRLTGRLVSPAFIVEHDWLHLLIGGGRHPGGTGVHIVDADDDEVLRRLTGHDAIELRRDRFDLRELRGRTVRIVIFDEMTGGWGNIRADELVLSDRAELGPNRSRTVSAVAAERGIDANRLAAWTSALEAIPADAADHPLAAWARAGATAPGDEARRTAWLAGATPAADLANWRTTWDATGWAFDAAARPIGDWRSPGESIGVVDSTGPDSAALARTLEGTLRSPTFEITSPFLVARVRGTGRVRVIIDGYHLDEFNALLFESAIRNVARDRWHHVTHDLSAYVGHRAYYEVIDHRNNAGIAVDALWWSSERPGAWLDARPAAIPPADMAPGPRDDPDEIAIAGWLLGSGLAAADLPSDARDAFAAAARDCPAPVRAPAMTEGTPEDERLFIRGNHRELGDVAPRGFVASLLDSVAEPSPRGSGREELATMMLDPSNPMPARVMVNRVWHHLFGRGLSETTDDFGLLGASPTHPELLDHLAHRFRYEMGWSVKMLVREIATSRTYATASGPPSPLAGEVDASNRLLSFRTPRRLDGEAIRDAILATSGRLDRTMYGPPVAVHLTPFMNGRGRPRNSGPLDGDGRRSVYLGVRRNFLTPMMQAFDAPVPHSTMGTRARSNVPAQSLMLLNDPFVRQQSEVLAARVRTEVGDDPHDQVDRLVILALGRPATGDERRAMTDFLAEPAPEGGPGPLADLCHVVLNLKEFSFLD